MIIHGKRERNKDGRFPQYCDLGNRCGAGAADNQVGLAIGAEARAAEAQRPHPPLRGGERQQVLRVAGQKVAVDICYEDAFGEEIINYLPEASLLVNVTNDAWYGKSHAAMQHNQLSQMRALESGRMMLRATNTGVTSIIGPHGDILQMLPQHEEGVLTGMAQGYSGSTPYVRWGNAVMLLLIALMLAATWLLRHRKFSPQSKG
jgi:apolipoprotein N-acyltransferase